MGTETQAKQLAEELSFIEFESGHLLDDDSVSFMARLRARSILTEEEWNRVKEFLRSALKFLSTSKHNNHASEKNLVLDTGADPRNADRLQLDAAQRLAGRFLPSWAALWLWQLRASDSSAFWHKVGRIAGDLGMPPVPTISDDSELVFQEQWKVNPPIIVLRPLRKGETPLRNLCPSDTRWLETAFVNLMRVDEWRMREGSDAYCIFEVGPAYFQCFAPVYDRYLRCESASENYVPEIARVLTREKKERLVREFGFTPPASPKNFSRKIEIQNAFDLAYVARLAFRVLRDVYGVQHFASTNFKSSPQEKG